MLKENVVQSFDERRDIFIGENKEKTIDFCAEHWIHSAKRAIQQRGQFTVALSGGSTPKAIYQTLFAKHQKSIEWNKVFLFWSDERAVPPTSSESNYHMAMQNGFSALKIPESHIFRIHAELNPQKAANDYDDLIKRELGPTRFDLVMLGVGEDGHTASLFPNSPALQEKEKLVAANQIPDTGQHRLTLTFSGIHRSQNIMMIALGDTKQAIVSLALRAAIVSPFPASRIGTKDHKALWILDRAAAHLLF